jgi:hypothetical protein
MGIFSNPCIIRIGRAGSDSPPDIYDWLAFSKHGVWRFAFFPFFGTHIYHHCNLYDHIRHQKVFFAAFYFFIIPITNLVLCGRTITDSESGE